MLFLYCLHPVYVKTLDFLKLTKALTKTYTLNQSYRIIFLEKNSGQEPSGSYKSGNENLLLWAKKTPLSIIEYKTRYTEVMPPSVVGRVHERLTRNGQQFEHFT